MKCGLGGPDDRAINQFLDEVDSLDLEWRRGPGDRGGAID